MTLTPAYYEHLYIFAAILWSIGAFLELDDRSKLEDFLRASTEFSLDLPKIPQGTDGTMFDYFVNKNGGWYSASKFGRSHEGIKS